MTKDEMRAANVAAMGQALGEVYTELWQEVARLFGKWEEYVVLFGTKESRIHLMNEAASDFFGKLQQSGFNEVLLDVACVTDPAEINKKTNLSVQALPALIADQALRQRVSSLIVAALDAAKFARDWRNRYLAHRDLNLMLGKARPLEDASRQKTWTALHALAAVLNEVERAYKNSETKFDFSGSGPLRGAEALLRVLDDGVRVERERRERLLSGRVLPGDYARDDV